MRYLKVVVLDETYRPQDLGVTVDMGAGFAILGAAAMQRVAQAAKFALAKELMKAKAWRRGDEDS